MQYFSLNKQNVFNEERKKKVIIFTWQLIIMPLH